MFMPPCDRTRIQNVEAKQTDKLQLGVASDEYDDKKSLLDFDVKIDIDSTLASPPPAEDETLETKLPNDDGAQLTFDPSTVGVRGGWVCE